MFERNRIDNAAQQMTVPAELTLADGEILKGRFLVASSRSIYDVLNGDVHFLDFETFNGERALIARATIRAVRLLPVAAANQLKNRLRDGDTFDPYQVLGVSGDAAWEEVRAAYLRLSKTYHPDRFAGVDLPGEVRDYLAAMARRINTAYAALEAPMQAAKRAAIDKARPIYSSPLHR